MRELFQCVTHARRRLEFGREGFHVFIAKQRFEIVGKYDTFVRDHLDDAGNGAAQELGAPFACRDGIPVPAEQRREHPVGDDLAVDQHAVAVKDDQHPNLESVPATVLA